MRIVVAPDSFKESMTAGVAASAMVSGIRDVCYDVEVVKIPLADGGEGTADILNNYFGANRYKSEVTGPLGNMITVEYGVTTDNIAIMDVASVIGLQLVSRDERNPLKTTSYGLGELIIDALNRGARKFIIGLGGSATNDGGIGMAQALGVELTDQDGKSVPLGGEGLMKLKNISLKKIDPRLLDCTFTIAADVRNKLLGDDGATFVYGAQKGADHQMLQQLEQGMENYVSVLKRDLQMDVTGTIGAGAAGGLGAAFYAFLDAEIKPGIDYIIELVELEQRISEATLVFTGEGKIDDQTLQGKVPLGVAKLAAKFDVPVVAIVGANKVTTDKIYEAGIRAIFPIVNEPMPLSDALDQAETLTRITVANVMRLFMNNY